MAESSAKSLSNHATGSRRHFGAQVVLFNNKFVPADPPHVFDHHAWKSAQPVGTGRGANWYVDSGDDSCVLRHFRRGGAVARILGNKYWFRSEQTTRSFAEFNLLLELREQKLPVPEPMAAGYCKKGPWYTAQLLTRRIPDARSWSAVLQETTKSDVLWGRIGTTIAQLHNACVDHADLNAHNVLVDSAESVFVIDFDKSFKRSSVQGEWRQANLARLRRSLHKILPQEGANLDRGWVMLLEAYAAQSSPDS